MPLHPIKALDHVIDEYADYLRTEFRARDPRLREPPENFQPLGHRKEIDAVAADAFGLSRDQYEHVLSTFRHKSFPKAPDLCLAKFDELKKIGLDPFTRKYDPYHDIPLNENLPQPVIDLPLREETEKNKQGELF